MVCPVLEQASQQNIEIATEYPYESLYRPWSWVLSTLSNFLLFAVVFLVGYALYQRRRKILESRSTVSYRRVVISKEEERKDNVLVIGTGGNLGRHLVDRLLKDGGYNVHCLDSNIPYPEERSSDVCSYTEADVCSYDDMLLCIKGIHAVFHTDSFTPYDSFTKKANFHHHNVTGTENIVRVCRECHVKRLVYTSTVKVVVGKEWKQQEADETVPYPKSQRNVYLASLASAEQVVLNSNGTDGLVTCAMRLPPVMCSENDPLVKCLLTQSALVVKNSGHGVTIGSASAIAEAHIRAEKSLCSGTMSVAAGKAYNLGGKTRILYRDFVGTLASDDETIWRQSPPTEVSGFQLTFLAYLNLYWYKITGALLTSKNISPLMLDMVTTELSFSSARAHRDLGWEDQGDWQKIVASFVHTHQAGQEAKKEQ